jgi:oxygen-independent coproporphyrinogen III oxidase
MPATASTSLTTGETEYNWQREPVGLYIHIPFCQSKCIYCDFNSYARMESRFEAFVEALCTDIERGVAGAIASGNGDEGAPISSVFMGGGTPSVLTPEQIGRILSAIRKKYSLDPHAEVTMEANPGTISLNHFRGYREAGVNRLSMGVQVLDDVMLKKLGRIHTSEGAIESYRLAREADFRNINLDFIIGLPGQDLSHLEGVLSLLLVLEPMPEHLSVYTLIVEENTPLYTGVRRGLISVPPDDDVADMYLRTGQRLAQAGYRQYEISNWTRGEPCRHNLIYWHDQRYLAFGPGAHGYWGDTRYSTVLGPDEYIRRVRSGESVIASQDEVDLRTEMGEFMMLGLRLNAGIPKSEFKRRFGVEVEEVFAPELERLEVQGLLEPGPVMRLTDHGRLLGNEVFGAFLA